MKRCRECGADLVERVTRIPSTQRVHRWTPKVYCSVRCRNAVASRRSHVLTVTTRRKALPSGA